MTKAENKRTRHDNVKVELDVEWNGSYHGLDNVEASGYSFHTLH